MHDAQRMRRLQRARGLTSERQHVRHLQRTALNPRGQRIAVDQLHRDVRTAIQSIADLVDHADVRMIQRRRRARFTLEALPRIRIAREMRPRQLQRDAAAERDVFGNPHLAHAAFAEPIEDAVVPDLARRGRGLDAAGLRFVRRFRRRVADDVMERVARRTIVRQQRNHFVQELGIAGTERVKPPIALGGREIDDGVEDLAGALPTIGSRQFSSSHRQRNPTCACIVREDVRHFRIQQTTTRPTDCAYFPERSMKRMLFVVAAAALTACSSPPASPPADSAAHAAPTGRRRAR